MIGCAKDFNSTIYSLMFSMFETKPKKTLEYMVYVNAKYSLLKAILMQLLKGQLKIFFFLLKVDLPHHVLSKKLLFGKNES